MATQVITRTLCDFCQADDVVSPDAARVIITIDADRWEVDVCEPHGQPLRDLGATLAEFARKVPIRGGAVGVLVAGATNSDESVVCPLCGKTYRNRSSLGSHGRAVHDKTVGQLFGNDTGKSFTCEDCGRVFDTPQGFAVHRQRLHPSASEAGGEE